MSDPWSRGSLKCCSTKTVYICDVYCALSRGTGTFIKRGIPLPFGRDVVQTTLPEMEVSMHERFHQFKNMCWLVTGDIFSIYKMFIVYLCWRYAWILLTLNPVHIYTWHCPFIGRYNCRGINVMNHVYVHPPCSDSTTFVHRLFILVGRLRLKFVELPNELYFCRDLVLSEPSSGRFKTPVYRLQVYGNLIAFQTLQRNYQN